MSNFSCSNTCSPQNDKYSPKTYTFAAWGRTESGRLSLEVQLKQDLSLCCWPSVYATVVRNTFIFKYMHCLRASFPLLLDTPDISFKKKKTGAKLYCSYGCWKQFNYWECKHSSTSAPDRRTFQSKHLAEVWTVLALCCLMCLRLTGGDECLHAVAVFRVNVLLTGRGLISRIGWHSLPWSVSLMASSSFKVNAKLLRCKNRPWRHTLLHTSVCVCVLSD